MNAYNVLGVDPESDDEAIREAFKRQAKALHPDHNKRPTAGKEFEEVSRAYETLKDLDLRRKHDYALMRVAVKDVPDDAMDDALDEFAMDRPKKKKKKKKKKVAAEEVHDFNYQPPPYHPPVSHQHEGRGKGAFEGIPDGFDQDQSCGGLL